MPAIVTDTAQRMSFHQLRQFMSLKEIGDMISDMSPDEAYKLNYDYEFWARPAQIQPARPHRVWLFWGGRGIGKTWVGANNIRKWSKRYPRHMMIGRTAYDVRDVMIEGPSGVLAVCPKQWRPKYEPSKRRLIWPNRAITLLRSADEPDSMRGPQFHKAWGDEVAAWRYGEESMSNILFGLRLGDDPQLLLTTTPRPTKLMKSIIKEDTTAITHETTYYNAENMSEQWIKEVVKKYKNTRIGKQELLGQILDDNPNALWNRLLLDELRVGITPHLDEIVVAIDPMTAEIAAEDLRKANVTGMEEISSTGIVAAGRSGVKGDLNSHFYALEDATMQGTPRQWGMQAISLYHKYGADRIVAEANNGGALVKANLHAIDPNVKVELVYAARGKRTRAEPVSTIYEQGRAHHLGMFPELEDQMCQWQPGMDSPDNMDALVWAATDLMVDPDEQRLYAVN